MNTDITASKVTRDANAARIQLNNGILEICPLTQTAIRVRFAHRTVPEAASLILVEKVDPPQFEIIESPETVTVATTALSIMINRMTGALSFSDAIHRVLLTEKAGGRILHPSTVQSEPTVSIEQTFISPPDERLFGSGQFQDGYLNIRDLPRRLTQVNSQIAIPFVISSKGYGLLWHNYGLTELNPADERIILKSSGEGSTTLVEVTSTEGTTLETRTESTFLGTFTVPTAGRHAMMLDVGATMARRHFVEIDGKVAIDVTNYWLPPTTSWHMELSAGEHRVRVIGEKNDAPSILLRPSADETRLRSPVAEGIDYVFFGGKADEILAAYYTLSGHVPMMPSWSLGYIHCRERFSSQKQLLATAAEFRRRGLAVDVIVQDWQYWGKYGWNAMRFDEADYPDPAEMVRELHAMNMRLMVSVWSKIDPESDLGKEFGNRGFYIPGTQWVDFFNPDAAAFYWKNFSDKLLALGIDAWWQDATEPENDDLLGRRTAEGPGERMRNVYPLLVTKTVYNGQRQDAPNQRVCILTRSAFPGAHRYASAAWSGDIGNDWETLRRQIPAGLNLTVTGLPYWTTDCGGFFRPGTEQFRDPAYHERFIRWFQYATFCPLQRVHGYQTDTEFWRYGDVLTTQVRGYLTLRYRMLPYIYSEAARVSSTGVALMRPLVMDFTEDTAALDQKHEFMFGPAFLVSPVLEAGVKIWPVYLPCNEAGWIDFWTGVHHEGGQTIDAAAPLDQIPLHVRAGSIVSLGPTKQFTAEKGADPIELRVYAGADSFFALYEDDGITYGYEKGQSAMIPITWNEERKTLIIGRREGDFRGMLKERSFRIVWVREHHGTGIEAAEKADVDVRYTGEAVAIPRA